MLNKITSIAIAALIYGAQHIKTEYVDYTTGNGADWPELFPGCAGSNQSPIDLTYGAEVLDANIDNFTKHYENIEDDIRKAKPSKVVWDGDKSTVYVKYDTASGGL